MQKSLEEAEREAAKKRQAAGKSGDGLAGGRGKALGNDLPKVSHFGETDERLSQQFETNREYVRKASDCGGREGWKVASSGTATDALPRLAGSRTSGG